MRKTTSKSILSKAHKVSEIARILTALFYGRSGTGKTTIAGTFPKPVLFLDIGERGTDSVFNIDGVSSLEIGSWGDLEEAYWALESEDHGYKTIVVDAVHSMQGLAIQEAREIAKKKEKDPTSQRDFGQATSLMNQWIYNLRDLRDKGINVVFLAHDRVRETDSDEDTVIVPEVGPNLMPSVGKTLLGAVNIVGQTYIREEVTKSKVAGQKSLREIQYCMRLGPHSVYHTKIRSPKDYAVPEFIVDPTFDKLLAVIEGKTGDTPRRSGTAKRTVRKTTRK